jgi:hypothetical protein
MEKMFPSKQDSALTNSRLLKLSTEKTELKKLGTMMRMKRKVVMKNTQMKRSSPHQARKVKPISTEMTPRNQLVEVKVVVERDAEPKAMTRRRQLFQDKARDQTLRNSRIS